jgi:hypothetical protein
MIAAAAGKGCYKIISLIFPSNDDSDDGVELRSWRTLGWRSRRVGGRYGDSVDEYASAKW